VCGLTAMATAAVTDGAYAILGGRTGKIMSRQRIRLASRLSGLFLIGAECGSPSHAPLMRCCLP